MSNFGDVTSGGPGGGAAIDGNGSGSSGSGSGSGSIRPFFNSGGGVLGCGGVIDLYTPVLLAFTQAQVLLWCIDVTGTNHAHCRREILLGVSIVVSLSSWLGAGLFYHLFTYLLGSKGGLLQSLCVTGYGIFGSAAALVGCQLLALLSRLTGVRVSHEIPLFLLGVPSGYAMAASFVGTIRVVAPTPAHQHQHHHRGRCLGGGAGGAGTGSSAGAGDVGGSGTTARGGSFVGSVKSWSTWAWPQFLCCFVILIAHYEILRYIFHIVIPNQQHACNAFSALSPADVAKFLSNPGNLVPNIKGNPSTFT